MEEGISSSDLLTPGPSQTVESISSGEISNKSATIQIVGVDNGTQRENTWHASPKMTACLGCLLVIPEGEMDEHRKTCKAANSLSPSVSVSSGSQDFQDDWFDPFAKPKSPLPPAENSSIAADIAHQANNSANLRPRRKLILEDEDENHPEGPNSSDRTFSAQTPASQQQPEDKMPCPICAAEIAITKLNDHVNICLDKPAAEPMEIWKEKQEVVNVHQGKEEAKPAEKNDYMLEQQEAYNFWRKKVEQEEADRLMALNLTGENKKEQEPPKKQANSVEEDEFIAREILRLEEELARKELEDRKVAEEFWIKEQQAIARQMELKEEEDARLAKELWEKENVKASEDEDERLARQLWAKEQENEERIKQKKDLEAALDLVRDEARQEADEALARLMKEKEELLSQINNLKNAYEDAPVDQVSLSLKDVEYPKFWQHQVADFQSFDVKGGTEEYNWITSHFKKGLPQVKINRIERIQNKPLWMWYFLKRKQIGANNKNNPNEMHLFHGSRNDAYDIILKEGLDFRVANLGGSIGAGIYFATNSATSSGYVAANGYSKKMLVCRVVLGSVGPGVHGLRRPPEKSKGKLHDSVGNAAMYVIFDNHQSYPEYVIHYQ
eukprot:TRINITY_DN2902_c0_g1_i1.p1 TRINITY_DN2902_c0_g1~~TRINITY_DN2902_c0_g1_i1.p1  ORF type:complete len:612 (-),score=194.07 TRINITY_DN2902_c0_g1_i1:8-1843(-)